jgi:hypothetical protein
VSRHKYPALDAWHRELAAGERATETFDALWRAACCEANAREFESIPRIHQAFMEDARQIVLEAAERQRGGEAA